MTAFKHNILAHLAFALIARQKRCLLSTAGSDCTCKLVTLTVHLRRSCSEEDLLLTVLFKWRRNCQTEGRHCGKKKQEQRNKRSQSAHMGVCFYFDQI